MKFRVDYRLSNGKEFYLVYDNDDNKLTNWDGTVLNPTDNTEKLKTIPMYEKTQGNRIKHITIILGLSCNLHCEYCPQRKRNLNVKPITSKSIDYLANNLNRIKPSSIELFGGEPLVYYKLFIQLLDKLNYTLESITVYTNGTLLNEQLIDNLAARNVKLKITYDSAHNRDKLYNTKILQYANQKLDCIFYAVLDKECTYEKLQALSKSLGVKLNEIPLKTRDEEFSPTEEYIKNVEQITYMSDAKTTNMYRQRFYDAVSTRLQKPQLEHVACYLDTRGLCIDGEGNTYNCKIVPIKQKYNISRISTYDNGNNLTKYYQWYERPGCNDCHLLSICRGECPSLNEYSHEQTCKSFKPYFNGIFKSAIDRMIGAKVFSITPIS